MEWKKERTGQTSRGIRGGGNGVRKEQMAGMFDEREEWREARDGLVSEVMRLGFDEALGKQIAKNLGSPKAMDRMAAYLRYEKPKKVEIVVDEMLAIKSEIEAWREKKESEEASAKYYAMRRRGPLGEDAE